MPVGAVSNRASELPVGAVFNRASERCHPGRRGFQPRILAGVISVGAVFNRAS